MRLLYHPCHLADAHFVKQLLEHDGMRVIVRGEFLAGGIGELPADVLSVWIVDDQDAERAQAVLRELSRNRRTQQGGVAWICATCGESLESQFTHCWQCGGARQP